jgi:hypothetical protein
MVPEPHHDAAPVLPPNLIIKKCNNLWTMIGEGAASKFLPGAGAALK